MIFAHEPVRINLGDGTVSNSVCTVLKNENKTISIALDDSCGRLSRLSRSDIRLFVEGGDEESADVTCHVFPCESGTIPATKENFQKAWEWLNE